MLLDWTMSSESTKLPMFIAWLLYCQPADKSILEELSNWTWVHCLIAFKQQEITKLKNSSGQAQLLHSEATARKTLHKKPSWIHPQSTELLKKQANCGANTTTEDMALMLEAWDTQDL